LNFEQLVGYLGEARQHRAMLMVRRPGNAADAICSGPGTGGCAERGEDFSLQAGVGYIRVNGFDPQTSKQFKDAVEKTGPVRN